MNPTTCLLRLFSVLTAALLAGCDKPAASRPGPAPSVSAKPSAVPAPDGKPAAGKSPGGYAEARAQFRTRLQRKMAAPQEYGETVPPEGVDEISYRSGSLDLKAWVSAAKGTEPRPAMLFLHGGFSFAVEDWDQAQPYRDAGFVVLMPGLRGENGLPGQYSMFYHEVEDVLAAAEVLAGRPGVDDRRVFVAGHSVGGTLAMLAAMLSDRFRAAASFSGSPEQQSWSRGQLQLVPFDPRDAEEYRMRSPMAFASSFRCPVRLYHGIEEDFFRERTKRLAELAAAAGLDVKAVPVPGDHGSHVEEAMAQSIEFFRSAEGR